MYIIRKSPILQPQFKKNINLKKRKAMSSNYFNWKGEKPFYIRTETVVRKTVKKRRQLINKELITADSFLRNYSASILQMERPCIITWYYTFDTERSVQFIRKEMLQHWRNFLKSQSKAGYPISGLRVVKTQEINHNLIPYFIILVDSAACDVKPLLKFVLQHSTKLESIEYRFTNVSLQRRFADSTELINTGADVIQNEFLYMYKSQLSIFESALVCGCFEMSSRDTNKRLNIFFRRGEMSDIISKVLSANIHSPLLVEASLSDKGFRNYQPFGKFGINLVNE